MNASATQTAEFERALKALGFTRDAGTIQPAWRGNWNGRECVVRIVKQGRTQYTGDVRHRTTLGYRLGIDLETRVRTRLFFVRERIARNALMRWIYRLGGQTTLPAVPEPLRGFAAVTIEPAWAQRFLLESDAIETIGELMHEGASPTFAGSVYLMLTSKMGLVSFGSPILPLEYFNSARLQSALERLERIAATAERLPAPQVVKEVGAIGRFSEQHPWAIAVAVLFGGMAVLALGALVVMLIVFAVFVAMR